MSGGDTRTVAYNGHTFELERAPHGEWLVFVRDERFEQVGTIDPSGECVGYGMEPPVRDRDIFEIAQRADLGIARLYPASQLAPHRKRGDA